MATTVQSFLKDIEAQSQFSDESNQKLNGLWSRLFWMFGLQLHNDEGNYFPKWKKFVIILLTRGLFFLLSLRYIVLTVRLQLYEMFVIYFPCVLFNTLSIFTVFVLQKREAEISLLYQSLLDLIPQSSDNNRRMKRYIYSVLFIIVGFNLLLLVFVILMLINSDKFFPATMIIPTEFNSYLLRVYLLFESIFYIIFTQIFLDFSVLYFSFMCKVLSMAFENLNYEIECAFVLKCTLTNAKLNAFRRRYRYFSHLMGKISAHFSPLILFWLLGLIFIICMRIRCVKSNSELSFRLYFAFDAFHLVYIVLVMFKNASQLHTQIGKMKGKISEIMISDDEIVENTNQECIFINCLLFNQTLNADNVGISVSGLFQLSTFSFLNMASTVMTYIVLVYQS
uniref:Gustatory receptor n=1 Tax=Strigamia maritima TaxID=126957 RepID=T1IP31_STRMM